MAEDDVNVAPEQTESGVAPENTETGGDTSSSGSWPAEAQAEYTRKTQALADERKQWTAICTAVAAAAICETGTATIATDTAIK